MAIIEVNNVTKEFQLGQLKNLKHTMRNAIDRLRGKQVDKSKPFKALDDVSFKVEPGEVLGIIGTNGAGKSTLLKMLARISVPTYGNVTVNGSVAPLIEVGAGLVGDLTGRENIYLNGTILGLSREAIRKKMDEIIAFAELEEFINTPIKRYSSGMAVRLGFSIATSVEADILIVDEVLAVGDLAFQRKCFDRIEEMINNQGKTVLLVSHNLRQVERLCSRVILMDHGKIVNDGLANDVCNMFYEKSDEKIKLNVHKKLSISNKNQQATGEVELLDLRIIDSNGNATDKILYKSDICVSIKVRVITEINSVTFGLGVHTTDFLYLTTHNSGHQVDIQQMSPGEYDIRCYIRSFPLLPGVYSLRLGIAADVFARTIFYGENLFGYQVVMKVNEQLPVTLRDGFFVLDANWSLEGLSHDKSKMSNM